MNKTLKGNLFWGLGLSLVILMASSVASFISIRNLIKSTGLVQKNTELIESLNALLATLKDAETGQRGFIITGNPGFLETYSSARSESARQLGELKLLTQEKPMHEKTLSDLELNVAGRLEALERNLKLKRDFNMVNEEDLLAGKQFMDKIRLNIQQMKTAEKMTMDAELEDLNSLATYTPTIIVITVLLALVIILLFFRKVVLDFDEKEKLQLALEQKNNEIEERLRAMQEVALQISQGNYDLRFDYKTQDSLGSLSRAVNEMAASLKTSFDRLETQNWLQSGIASLNNVMVGNRSLSGLCADVLENISGYTQSIMAALYVLEGDELVLTATYAVDESAMKKSIRPGEGLCGQAFLSGKMLRLRGVPQDEATISFALGKTKPAVVKAIPLFYYGQKVGVMEFASVRLYEPREVAFFEETADAVGLAVHGAQSRRRLQELLEETQSQAEELQSQHAELESINTELEAQSLKLQASEEELRVQQEELMQSNQELEERTTLLEEKNQMVEERNREIQEKSAELEQSSRYKSEFLANMSHELRTPLNSILLLSNLMNESEVLNDEYKEYAAVIQSSGQGLLTLIDEILDLSKIEAGKMDLDVEETSVAEVLENMRSLFNPQAKNKGLVLHLDIAENTRREIVTDRGRLEQVLRNLLSNAIKFTKSGSVRLSVSSDDERQRMIFDVNDTGIGIAPEKQSLIFEAFQQADGSTKRKFGGTGLGLSISKELIRLLRGKISVESEEGKGSHFRVEIPYFYEMPTLAQEARLPVPVRQPVVRESRYLATEVPAGLEDDRDNIQNGDQVILIVEDDTAFAKVLMNFARDKQYKVVSAVRGDEGLMLATEYRPQAIILDIQLPVMDGWQVMEALKANPVTRAIPVHIISSFKMKREGLMKGAVDFIAKPIEGQQIEQVFNKLEAVAKKQVKKVLVIEENEQHAKALGYFLAAHSIDTEISRNIEDSISLLSNHDVECVILDMGVPGRNSFAALEVVKETPGLEYVPIIVFTGSSLSIAEEARLKKYADSIVVKTAQSYQRILDEAGLFLHQVAENKKQARSVARNYETNRELKNILKDKVVLIADDDVRNIFSLTKALETQGMIVLAATDGREALQIVQDREDIDLILMDMMMPELDGYETIRKIRVVAGYQKTPVIAVTAKAMVGDREKCILAGANDYISKPVDLDQLVSLLRVWLYDKS